MGSSDLDLDRYERRLRAQGFGRIAGADEAGRGALAGPLVAAAVILPESFDLDGVNDSKVLTRLQRERAYGRIVEQAVAVSVCRATSSEGRERLAALRPSTVFRAIVLRGLLLGGSFCSSAQ